MNKLILIFLIILNIKLNFCQTINTISWSGGIDCSNNFGDSNCWTPNLVPAIDTAVTFGLAGSQINLNKTQVSNTNNITVDSIVINQDSQLKISDSLLNVANSISMTQSSRLTLGLSDSYFSLLTNGAATKNAMNVLMNLPSIQTMKTSSLEMFGSSIIDVFRSTSTVNGQFTMNDNANVYMISKQNGDSKFEANSTVVNDNAVINFQGQSYILLNNTDKSSNGGIKLNGNSKLVAMNADNVQVTGVLTLGGSSSIQLTESQLYLDSLVTSSASTSISVVSSTLSILLAAPTVFAPGSATFTNSVFSVKNNLQVNTAFTMTDSIFSINSTTTLNAQLTGTNVFLLLDVATFNGGSNFACSGCAFAIRNSIVNLDSYTNDGDINMANSQFNVAQSTPLISTSGNIYGYYGSFNKGLTIQSGSLGLYNERTRIFIDGNVVIQSAGKIQLFLSSPLDFSWINTTGALDIQQGSVIEVYVYIEILNNSTMEIIKTTNGFTTPLVIGENIKLFSLDPDNDIATPFTDCQYTITLSSTSVFVNTNYDCQQGVIVTGTSGLSKGELAGISVSMVAVAAVVSVGVWLKIAKKEKTRFNDPENGNEMKDKKSFQKPVIGQNNE